MTEETLEGKFRRKKRKKSFMQFDEITLSELIAISNEPFLVEGTVLSTSGTHFHGPMGGFNEFSPVQDFPLLPDEDIQ
ncbi:MAG TPA: hypothetical protein VLM75_13100 [Spirochaetota bacterium]|nr:hypothetical protein [Spirochaetota bacterium]